MVFKKKYPNYYYAKIWEPYIEIDKREIASIVGDIYHLNSKGEVYRYIRYGKKPMCNSYYRELTRIVYDESAEKEKPERCSEPYAYYQVAILGKNLYVRRVRKHIGRTTKEDIMSFKQYFSNSYFVSDSRFRRMRLSAKHFKLFKREEHNLIHRVLSSLHKKHYNGREYSKALWREVAEAHNLKLHYF